MLTAAGAVGVSAIRTALPPGGLAIHEMGTARMGRDPTTSYLERLQPVARGVQPVRYRRRVHDVDRGAESVADLYGVDGTRRQSCGRTAQGRPALKGWPLPQRAGGGAVRSRTTSSWGRVIDARPSAFLERIASSISTALRPIVSLG